MNKLVVAAAALAISAVAAVAAPVRPVVLADLGVPAIELANFNQMLGYATVLGSSGQKPIDDRCSVVIASPGAYGADAYAYCNAFKLAVSLSPRTRTDLDFN
ncbi:MAG: hypothetical protein U1E56_00980 [Bauldia sp.]